MSSSWPTRSTSATVSPPRPCWKHFQSPTPNTPFRTQHTPPSSPCDRVTQGPMRCYQRKTGRRGNGNQRAGRAPGRPPRRRGAAASVATSVTTSSTAASDATSAAASMSESEGAAAVVSAGAGVSAGAAAALPAAPELAPVGGCCARRLSCSVVYVCCAGGVPPPPHEQNTHTVRAPKISNHALPNTRRCIASSGAGNIHQARKENIHGLWVACPPSNSMKSHPVTLHVGEHAAKAFTRQSPTQRQQGTNYSSAPGINTT